MRPQLTDAYTKQQCLKMMGIINNFPNTEKMLKSYGNLSKNNYSMTAPNKNPEMFYFDLTNSIINPIHLTKELGHDFEFPTYNANEEDVFHDSPSRFDNQNESDEDYDDDSYSNNSGNDARNLDFETPEFDRGRSMERSGQQPRNQRSRSPRSQRRLDFIGQSPEIQMEVDENDGRERRNRNQTNFFSPSTNY